MSTPVPDLSPPPATIQPVDPLIGELRIRERYRDHYWEGSDPILSDRLHWRAQTLRHTVHLLPGESILELGSGGGHFTAALRSVTRGENPVTAAAFNDHGLPGSEGPVERVVVEQLPGPLQYRRFDVIVAMDLLGGPQTPDLLSILYHLLKPGGEILLYESNPWNPVWRLRATVGKWLGRRDPRVLLPRTQLYELLSEIGFIRVYSNFNDFVYAPLTRRMIWFLRNLSILLENAPSIAPLAGSILLHGQTPPREKQRALLSLVRHSELANRVSVVIPARNEEMNVEPLLTDLLGLYGGYIKEVIVVNDGSSDRTGEMIDAMHRRDARVRALHRSPPHGVGHAIAAGLRAATGEWVLTMDCDFRHLLPELRDLFEAAAAGNDVVVGSRFSRHSVLLNYPFGKILANRAFHTLARLFLRHRFRDVTNNLKLMRGEVARDLVLTQPGFAVNAETGLQPFLLNYRVQEVPISWIDRTPGMGTSSFRLVKVGGGYGRVLWNLWLKRMFRRGPYRTLGRTRIPPRENL